MKGVARRSRQIHALILSDTDFSPFEHSLSPISYAPPRAQPRSCAFFVLCVSYPPPPAMSVRFFPRFSLCRGAPPFFPLLVRIRVVLWCGADPLIPPLHRGKRSAPPQLLLNRARIGYFGAVLWCLSLLWFRPFHWACVFPAAGVTTRPCLLLCCPPAQPSPLGVGRTGGRWRVPGTCGVAGAVGLACYTHTRTVPG